MPETQDYWFLDVAAVRIQTWLARSQRVRYRRGASFRLAEVTSEQKITEVLQQSELAPLVEVSPEAGAISGVVSMRFAAGDLTDDQAHTLALRAACAVSRAIREVFPALPLTASLGRADYYVKAYDPMHAAPPLLDLPAQGEEGFAARPCGMCRSARARFARVTLVRDDATDLCTDCHSRVEKRGAVGSVAGYSSAVPRSHLPTSQQGLDQKLQTATGSKNRYPGDFAELASWMGRAEDDAATHLATIFADGNRIGALMKRVGESLSTNPHAELDRNDIVATISEATKRAIGWAGQKATERIDPEALDPDVRSMVPMLVHLADGDDILVTVPAPLGWATVRALGEEFGAQLNLVQGFQELGVEPGDVSLSLGMVFHHARHPIADVVRLAESLLKAAKKQTNGEVAACAFLDLTPDGESSIGAVEGSPNAPRRALSLEELEGWSKQLDAAAGIPASHRATLLQLLRETYAEAHRGAVPHEAETARAALARRVITLGHRPIIDLVTTVPAEQDPPAPSQLARLREALLADDPAARNELRLKLDIVRWWDPQSGLSRMMAAESEALA